jgi:hypothetical protein
MGGGAKDAMRGGLSTPAQIFCEKIRHVAMQKHSPSNGGHYCLSCAPPDGILFVTVWRFAAPARCGQRCAVAGEFCLQEERRVKKKQLELFSNLPVVPDPNRYQGYMKSVRWKERSEATKALAGYQCQYFGPTCQWQDSLECHHLNYDNVFNETPGVDTICVCRSCHIYIHNLQADNDNDPLPSKG